MGPKPAFRFGRGRLQPPRRHGGIAPRGHYCRGAHTTGSAAGKGETALARIAGVNIPTNKRVVVALQYIHGIGPAKAGEIMEKVGIPGERRVSQLTDQEVLHIREVIDRDYLVEGDLRREVQ